MRRPDSTLMTSWVEEVVREVQRRQSELQDVEAKRVSQDLPKKLHKTLSAFGNREGGGIILLGVDETNAFAVSGIDDVARIQRDLINFVQTEMSYPLRLESTVADVDDRQVVAIQVMEAPFSQKPVYRRSLGLDKGSYYRSGTSNVQMTTEQIRQLIASQVELRDDYTARLVSTVEPEWYDPLELERLRRILKVARRGSELDALPAEDLLIKLQLTEHSGKRNLPTIAGLLLVGKQELIRQHVTEHEITFLLHPNDGEEYEGRSDMKQPLLWILDRVETQLEAANRILPIQLGLLRYEVSRLHPKVYREAMLNAIIHRNYLDYGSIFVRLYPNRLLISNPGGFLPGITPENLLTGSPKHRNRRLAESFQLLGMVERAGMGVPQMYRYQLENGKPAPAFASTESEVRVSISTQLIDERMAGFVASQYKAGHRFDLGDLLILNQLRNQRDIRTQEVADLTQRNHRAALDLANEMIKKDLLRRRGTGSGTVYIYSPSVHRVLGTAAQALRDASIESIRHPEMIAQYIRQEGRITNHECRILCDLDTSRASRLLRRLSETGFLERRGASLKFTYYVLPGETKDPKP